MKNLPKERNNSTHQTHVGGNAAPAAAGGGVQRLQPGNNLVQLTNELRVGGGTELGPQVLYAVDGDQLPGLKTVGDGGEKTRR